jgi:LuxR family maltose regulon positive regulatory protein
MARDDNEAALRGAEAMREAAAASSRKQLEITAALIAALALEKSGRRADALAHLAATVELGGRLGFVRTFLDEGPVLLMLLRELAALAAPGATPPSHAAELVRQASVGSASGGAAEGPVTTTDTLLTGREVEIVELVAAGMSNKRIALTLGISVETVKWNLKNIFTKLGVSSRYDAMVWARRQGLID